MHLRLAPAVLAVLYVPLSSAAGLAVFYANLGEVLRLLWTSDALASVVFAVGSAAAFLAAERVARSHALAGAAVGAVLTLAAYAAAFTLVLAARPAWLVGGFGGAPSVEVVLLGWPGILFGAVAPVAAARFLRPSHQRRSRMVVLRES